MGYGPRLVEHDPVYSKIIFVQKTINESRD